MKCEDSEVVPRIAHILKARWDAAASMAVVMEIKLRCGEFKVTWSKYGVSADKGEHDIVLLVVSGSPLQQQSTHIVKPAVQWCSDMARVPGSLPSCLYCVQKVDLNYVFTNLFGKNNTFGNVKNSFKGNVFPPVSLDGIKYDGVTKPPHVTSRQSGSAKDQTDKKTKRVPGCRWFTDHLFKLWLQRS